MCRNTTELQAHNPPILYNLWSDPGERDPLTPADSNYNQTLTMMIYVCNIKHPLNLYILMDNADYMYAICCYFIFSNAISS